MAPFDPEEVPEPESTSLFKMDNAVLSEKDRNIEIALECINYRLKEEEKAKDTVNSIKFDLLKIVFIGQNMDKEQIIRDLDKCLE